MDQIRKRAEELVLLYEKTGEHDSDFNIMFKDSAYGFIEDVLISLKDETEEDAPTDEVKCICSCGNEHMRPKTELD